MNIHDRTVGPDSGTAKKFDNPARTANGEERAHVDLRQLETLWINTGTLCNIECRNCYIESSPTNDRLVYIRADEAAVFLDEIQENGLGTREIGFTGGEPFMNPDMLAMAKDALGRGFEVLILTNAMRPMMRPSIRDGLLELRRDFGDRLGLRVSLDHHDKTFHEIERGPDAWEPALEGLRWLGQNGFRLSVAGRTCWEEPEAAARAGYAQLFRELGIGIDVHDNEQLVLFPEMDEQADVPEITVDCWSILGVDPNDVMCSSSRMVVKRKGAEKATVAACTLLPYDRRFELGETLSQAARPVALNHPHCAKFCVLGGGSCSRADG